MAWRFGFAPSKPKPAPAPAPEPEPKYAVRVCRSPRGAFSDDEAAQHIRATIALKHAAARGELTERYQRKCTPPREYPVAVRDDPRWEMLQRAPRVRAAAAAGPRHSRRRQRPPAAPCGARCCRWLQGTPPVPLLPWPPSWRRTCPRRRWARWRPDVARCRADVKGMRRR